MINMEFFVNHADADNLNANFNTNTQEPVDVCCISLQEDPSQSSKIDDACFYDCKNESEVTTFSSATNINKMEEYIAKRNIFIRFAMRFGLLIGAILLFDIAKFCAKFLGALLGLITAGGFPIIALFMLNKRYRNFINS